MVVAPAARRHRLQRAILAPPGRSADKRNDYALERGHSVCGEKDRYLPGRIQQRCAASSSSTTRSSRWRNSIRRRGRYASRRVTIYLKSHYVTTRETVLRAIETIKRTRRASRRIACAEKLVEMQRPRAAHALRFGNMAEIGYCNGIENSAGTLSGRALGTARTVRVFAGRRAAGGRREPRHHPAARRHVSRRPLAQGEPGRLRFPAAVRARQPPPKFEEWERMAPQMIFVSATPTLRGEACRAGGRTRVCGRPASSTPKSKYALARTQVDDLLSEIGLCNWRAASACW